MKIYSRTRPIQRYIALDIHKEYVLAGGMNVSQEWMLPPRRIEMSKFGGWVRKNLWDIHDIVQPLVVHAVKAAAGCKHCLTISGKIDDFYQY